MENDSMVRHPDGDAKIETECPHCDTKLDTAADASGGRAIPTPGDITVCAECGGWAEFADGLATAVPLYADDERLRNHPDVAKLDALLDGMALADQSDVFEAAKAAD